MDFKEALEILGIKEVLEFDSFREDLSINWKNLIIKYRESNNKKATRVNRAYDFLKKISYDEFNQIIKNNYPKNSSLIKTQNKDNHPKNSSLIKTQNKDNHPENSSLIKNQNNDNFTEINKNSYNYELNKQQYIFYTLKKYLVIIIITIPVVVLDAIEAYSDGNIFVFIRDFIAILLFLSALDSRVEITQKEIIYKISIREIKIPLHICKNIILEEGHLIINFSTIYKGKHKLDIWPFVNTKKIYKILQGFLNHY